MKLRKYLAISVLAVGLLSSCDLDLAPYNAIDTSLAFTSVADAQKWDTKFYADLRGRVYGHYIMSPDIQADQLNATADYGNNYGAVHRWSDLIADNYQVRDVWQGYYSALNNVNAAIQGFATISPKTDAEAENLKKYIGDAHLARAYYYYMLVNRYAKAYNASTAASDLGVPLVLVPDLNGTPSRSTVKEVYDQILADLAIAKSNLSTVAGKVNADKFNKDVVSALEAKIMLSMGNWDSAKTAAETLINSGTYKLYTTAADVKKMWHEDAPNETIFAPFVSMNEGANTNTIYIGYNANDKKYRPFFIPSKWVIDFYADSDFRKNTYFLKEVTINQGGKDYKGTIVNKYPGNPALYTGVTNYLHAPKVFRIAEMYLIASEASFRANPSNTQAALSHLNALRTARGLDALTGLSGNALFTEIKAERFRELAFEGQRLDDLKRWGEGFTRRDNQTPSELIQVGPDFNTKSVQASDNKFVWGIPDRDVVANPNIVQNPGW